MRAVRSGLASARRTGRWVVVGLLTGVAAPGVAGAQERCPAAVGPVVERGWDAYREGALARADSIFRAALERCPQHPGAHSGAGYVALRDGRTSDAARAFERALAVEPDQVDALVGLGLVRWREGRVAEAETRLARALEIVPDHPTALRQLALVRASRGATAEALDLVDRRLRTEPEDDEARAVRARILVWADRTEEALAAYDSLTRARPDDLDVRRSRADLLLVAGEWAAAATEYGKLVEVSPSSAAAWAGLGRALTRRGELIEGERALRRAVELDTARVETFVGLAQNLRWQGRNAAAQEVLERGGRIAPPEDGGVEEQEAWVRAALGPRVELSLALEDDSDGNTMLTTSVVSEVHPFPRLGVRVDGYRRGLRQERAGPELDRETLGWIVSASYHLEPGWSLSAGVGGSDSDAPGDPDFTHLRASIATPGRFPLSATLLFVRQALDVTALQAERGVETREVRLDVRWRLSPLWSFDGEVNRAELEGTAENSRLAARFTILRELPAGWAIGAAVRSFGYDEDVDDGYFDPDFYGLAEARARWLGETEGWSLRLEGAPGVQRIGGDGATSGTLRFTGALTRRIAPGREIRIGGTWSSAGFQSSASGESDYRYGSLSAGFAWVF